MIFLFIFFSYSQIFTNPRNFLAAEDSDIYNPKAPKLSEERMNYLWKFIAKEKSIVIHLGRVINPFGFSILWRCAPYLQSYSVGNHIPLMRNCQEITKRVPSESLIFTQKPRPRNLGNLKAIAFSNVANHPELPSDKDFKKAETMIGEFLKPSSADLPHTVEMAGQVLARPAKDASSLVSNDPSHPLRTQPPPPNPTKARTKQGFTKKQGELPQPSKSLVL